MYMSLFHFPGKCPDSGQLAGSTEAVFEEARACGDLRPLARPGLTDRRRLGDCRRFDFVAIRTAADRLFMWMALG